MALSNSHTFVALESVTAANLNGVITNILNNPISLVSPTTGAINFALQSHTNLIPAALTASSGSTGSVLTVSAAGTPIWATAAPRLLQLIGTSTAASVSITSTSVATVAGQPITFTSTSSRVKLIYSADAQVQPAVGAAQAITLQIFTSSGTLVGGQRTLGAQGTNNVGPQATAAWSILTAASTETAPITYAIQAFANTASSGGSLATISNINMIVEEWSS